MVCMFNAVQELPFFSCSAVVFVTNFIGVKKAETPQLFGLPQSRDVILIAVRPDCAAPAALPLLLLSFPTPLRLLLFAKFLFSLQALQNRRRRIQSDFSTLSLSFTPYHALPEVTPFPLLRNYKFSCYIITVSMSFVDQSRRQIVVMSGRSPLHFN